MYVSVRKFNPTGFGILKYTRINAVKCNNLIQIVEYINNSMFIHETLLYNIQKKFRSWVLKQVHNCNLKLFYKPFMYVCITVSQLTLPLRNFGKGSRLKYFAKR